MHVSDTPALSPLLARLTAAIGLLDSGDTDAAEQAALDLCEDYPRVADGFVLLARCATARGDGALALDRWLMCEARFADQQAKWQVGLAYAFLNADRLADAADAFAAALATDPTHQTALAGQATVVSRTAPLDAEPLWRALFDLAGGPPKADWQVRRSRALADSGQAAQAIAVLDQTLLDTPGHQPAVAMLARLRTLLAEAGSDARQHDSVPAAEDIPPVERAWQQRMRLDIKGARASLLAALQEARHAGAFTALLRPLPSLFQGFEKAQLWRAVRARLTAALPPDAPETICLQMRVDIALRDFDAFLQRWDASPPQPSPWDWRFARVAATLRAPAFPDFAAQKVFCIGLNKTGTSSLGQALDRLGYLHAHFDSPFTHDILSDMDFILFDAASDSPVSARFETLYAQFPNARFILTERPMEPWVRSFLGHFERWHGSGNTPFRRRSYDDLKDSVWGLDMRLAHGPLYPSHMDPKAAYDAHIRRVEHFFADKPAGKLLRHNVFRGDGWPELCAFLNRTIPDEPYPWANQAPEDLAHQALMKQ